MKKNQVKKNRVKKNRVKKKSTWRTYPPLFQIKKKIYKKNEKENRPAYLPCLKFSSNSKHTYFFLALVMILNHWTDLKLEDHTVETPIKYVENAYHVDNAK